MRRIHPVTEGKACEIDWCLGFEVEGIDETMDSSWDEMMYEN